MTTEMIIGITGFVFIAFLTCVIFHLERKLREARHDEMLWELADKALKRDCLMWRKKCLQLKINNDKLKTDHAKLEIQFKGLGLTPHDVTCLKDDCPDNESDACTRVFESCNQCTVRVIRTGTVRDTKCRGERR